MNRTNRNDCESGDSAQALIPTSPNVGLPPRPPPPPPLPPAARVSLPVPAPTPPHPHASRLDGPWSGLERKFTLATKVNSKPQEAEQPFKPCFFFFYGSLMDPEVLQAVLGLRELPVVQEGWVRGFMMKMWGIYPTLLPREGGKVFGTAWKVDSLSQFLRLQEYETSVYTWCPCQIELSNGESLLGCRTFCWAGDPNSKELVEGSFDLQRYQKHFKPSVVRKGPPKE